MGEEIPLVNKEIPIQKTSNNFLLSWLIIEKEKHIHGVPETSTLKWLFQLEVTPNPDLPSKNGWVFSSNMHLLQKLVGFRELKYIFYAPCNLQWFLVTILNPHLSHPWRISWFPKNCWNMPSSFSDLVLEKKQPSKGSNTLVTEIVGFKALLILYFMLWFATVWCLEQVKHISPNVTLYHWLEQLKKPATKTHLNTLGSKKSVAFQKTSACYPDHPL